MVDEVYYSTIVTRFEENNLHYEKLVAPSGIEFLLLERGARIFGPFIEKEKSGLFWVTPLFNEPEKFKSFLANNEWNIGGDRIWIAPEIQFNISNRYDFDGSYRLPKQMDPGAYLLTKEATNLYKYENNLNLEIQTNPSDVKKLSLSCFVSLCDNPLRNISEYQALEKDVTFGGYERLLSLEEQEPNQFLCEAWNLVQLIPGGKMIIPTSTLASPCFYRGSLDPSSYQNTHHALIIPMDGKNQYKFGVKAPFVFGRIGYFYHLGETSYLLVKNFFNNPSSVYCEEPPLQPGEHGFSIHVYNDDGGLGGFCEMEVNGQTIGAKAQKSKSVDSFLLWAYMGKTEAVQQICQWLLGVNPLSP